MSMHVVFDGVDEAEKSRLEAYWAKKLPRLRKLLVPYPEALQEIRLTLSRHKKDDSHALYEGRVVVHLPTGTLAAHAEGGNPQAVLDRLADEIVTEIKRHKGMVRRDFIYKRKRSDRADLSAAGPLLQKHAEIDHREDFFKLLRPHLRVVRDYVRRELRLLEKDKLLHRREVTVDDVLEEVLVEAWERFADRPRYVSLDLWLTNLVDDVLERIIKQEPRRHVSLEADAQKVLPPEELPKDDDKEWWSDLLDDEERLALEDLIPDAKATEAWNQLDVEEQTNKLLSMINELPRLQRQTFVLHALEDDNTAEIAMLQDRPEAEVKADIEAARRTLGERLIAEGAMEESGRPATASSAAGGRQGN